MRTKPFLTTDAAAVRAEHLAAFNRLTTALEEQGDELTDEGSRLFSRVAFSLYRDAKTIEEITPLDCFLNRSAPPSSP